ncbi:MAG: flagellar motor protein MotB [Bacteriovoracia bacterium]
MAVNDFLKAAKQIQEEEKKKQDPPKKGGHDDESNWLISYADMMTLLCGFFIMLFSMSSLSKPKYEAAAKEISEHFGAVKQDEVPNPELVNEMKKVIHESHLDKEVKVTSTQEGVTIVFASTVLFNSMSSYIREDGRTVLNQLIGTIKGQQEKGDERFKIVVEGHTDAQPILSGIYPSNWELSSARATKVVRMFHDEGFDPARLMAIGYADSRPEAKNRTLAGAWDEEALKKNRRVVIHVFDPSVDSIPWREKTAAPPPRAAASSGPAESAH